MVGVCMQICSKWHMRLDVMFHPCCSQSLKISPSYLPWSKTNMDYMVNSKFLWLIGFGLSADDHLHPNMGNNTNIDPVDFGKQTTLVSFLVFIWVNHATECNLTEKNNGILDEIHHAGSRIWSCTHLHDTKGRFLFHLNPHDEDLGHGNPGTEGVFFGPQCDSVKQLSSPIYSIP